MTRSWSGIHDSPMAPSSHTPRMNGPHSLTVQKRVSSTSSCDPRLIAQGTALASPMVLVEERSGGGADSIVGASCVRFRRQPDVSCCLRAQQAIPSTAGAGPQLHPRQSGMPSSAASAAGVRPQVLQRATVNTRSRHHEPTSVTGSQVREEVDDMSGKQKRNRGAGCRSQRGHDSQPR